MQPLQLIICGFHRSGTSMTAQALARSGLSMGESLIDGDPSNPDGHFEDIETVRLHDRWLQENESDWCHTGAAIAISPEKAQQSLGAIASRFNAASNTWGIKDPRASLFLEAWKSVLPHGRFLMMFRHYASCYDSLRRRQAKELLLHPSMEVSANRFWLQDELALRSWLAHNKALLSHYHQNPEHCLLVSQEAVVAGFDVITSLNNKFGASLNAQALTGVDKNKTRKPQQIAISGVSESLQSELEHTWNELQAISEKPAEHYSHVVWENATCTNNSCANNTSANNASANNTLSHDIDGERQKELAELKQSLCEYWNTFDIDVNSTACANTVAQTVWSSQSNSHAKTMPAENEERQNKAAQQQAIDNLLSSTDLNNRPAVRTALIALNNAERELFLRLACDLQKSNIFLKGQLGIVCFNNNELDHALPLLLEASSEKDASIWFHLGLLYQKQHKLELAIEAISTAVEANNNPDHLTLLIQILLENKQAKKAKVWCEKALSDHGEQLRFILLYADCLYANGEVEQALQWAESGTGAQPQPETYLKQCQLLTLQGRTDEAHKAHDRATLLGIRKINGYRGKAYALVNSVVSARSAVELVQLWNHEFLRMKKHLNLELRNSVKNSKPELVKGPQEHQATQFVDSIAATPRVAMSILVRDEVDIIGDNIRYHAALGVDHFIVTDNASVDGTRELLAELQSSYSIHIIDEPSHTIDQDLWVTRMAQQLQKQGGFDWVIHNDADEFWQPKHGDIPHAINTALEAHRAEDIGVLSCARYNMLADRSALEKADYAFYNNVHALRKTVSLLPGEQPWSDDNSNCIARTVMDKVLTRVAGLGSVGYGNHGAEHTLEKITCPEISVLHYPVRTYDQFERKVKNYGESLSRNDRLYAGSSLHLRYWYKQYLAGNLMDDYKQITFSESRLKQLRDDGFVELDERLLGFFTQIYDHSEPKKASS